MLVTLGNRGAALARIELSSPATTTSTTAAATSAIWSWKMIASATAVRCRSSAPGTPAAKAGLKSGDLIIALDGVGQPTPRLEQALAKTKPNRPFKLTVVRGGKEKALRHARLAAAGSRQPRGEDPLAICRRA